jgi:ribosomal protein L19E
MNRIIKPEKYFTQVSNNILVNPKISFKAKGLYAYLISKPDDYNFSATRIANESKEGRDSILNILNEIENSDYLHRVKKQDGKIDYYFFNFPGEKRKFLESQSSKVPKSDSPTQPPINNTDSNNNTNINKKKESEPSNFKLDDYKNNPNYPRWQSANFPDLTEEQIDVNLETYLADYPNAKHTSINNYLADVNKKLKKPDWIRAKEKETVYQDNLAEDKKKHEDQEEPSYGDLLSMDEALQEPQEEEFDQKLDELRKDIKQRLENGNIKASDYSTLSPSLFKSVMSTTIENQIEFFVGIEKGLIGRKDKKS